MSSSNDYQIFLSVACFYSYGLIVAFSLNAGQAYMTCGYSVIWHFIGVSCPLQGLFRYAAIGSCSVFPLHVDHHTLLWHYFCIHAMILRLKVKGR